MNDLVVSGVTMENEETAKRHEKREQREKEVKDLA